MRFKYWLNAKKSIECEGYTKVPGVHYIQKSIRFCDLTHDIVVNVPGSSFSDKLENLILDYYRLRYLKARSEL